MRKIRAIIPLLKKILKIQSPSTQILGYQYEYDYEKSYECVECQLEKYGEIEIEPDVTFIDVEDIEDLLR